MLRWDSYRTVYGAELRAAAREYSDHGWPVVGACSAGLLLATGTSLDVLEVPAAVGRLVCAQLRAAGIEAGYGVRELLGASVGIRLDFDPTLVRGMGYYTGPIFEIAHP